MINFYHVILRHQGKAKHLIRRNTTPEQAISEALKEHSHVPLDASKITANTIYLCGVCNDFENMTHGKLKYASHKINKDWLCKDCYSQKRGDKCLSK